MSYRLLVASVALAGCNFVYGLDKTKLKDQSPRVLTFDNRAAATDLVEFPVLVVIERTSELEITDPTTELRFEDTDTGADLPFEIERWVPGGESSVWVRVPTIAAGSTTDSILMHFGNEEDFGTTQGPNAAAVWNGYGLVAHGTVADGVVPDVTANGYPGRGAASVEPGVIGDAIGLGGLVTFENSTPLFDGWPQFTLELWLYADYPTASVTAGSEPSVLGRGGALDLGRVYQPRNQSVPTLPEHILRFQIDTRFDGLDELGEPNGAYQNVDFTIRRWTYVTFTYDGQSQYVYVNGEFAGRTSFTSPNPLRTGAGTFHLGNSNNTMVGMVDEVRVAPAYRDPYWVHAQYLSMTRRFATLGAHVDDMR